MSISITINAETADAARTEMLNLLGGVTLTVEGTTLPEPGEVIKAAAAQTGTGGGAGGIVDDPKTEVPAADKPKRGGKKAKETKADEPQIRTQPEARSNPEDDAQDAVDEAEASEAAAPETKTLTIDDVRGAAQAYIKKFGMEAAQVDLMGCLGKATGVEKISGLDPANQDQLAKAVAAFEAAAKADKRYGVA